MKEMLTVWRQTDGRDRQEDRQTGRQMDGTDRQEERQEDRQTDRQEEHGSLLLFFFSSL